MPLSSVALSDVVAAALGVEAASVLDVRTADPLAYGPSVRLSVRAWLVLFGPCLDDPAGGAACPTLFFHLVPLRIKGNSLPPGRSERFVSALSGAGESRGASAHQLGVVIDAAIVVVISSTVWVSSSGGGNGSSLRRPFVGGTGSRTFGSVLR